MSYKLVSQLKESASGILSGLDLDTVDDADPMLEISLSTVMEQVYLPEVQTKKTLTLYGGVTDYSPDDSFYGSAVIDIRKQGYSRNFNDKPRKLGIVDEDRIKNNNSLAYNIGFEYDNGTPIMRVVPPTALPKVDLDQMSDSGDWTAAGSASSLVEDSIDFYKTPASLRFTLTGSSTGTLTKAITSQDLSDYDNVGVVFLAIKTPDVTDLTSITLRIGSSSGAYNEVTATAAFLGDFKADEWQLITFDFSSNTETGSPDWSAIDYAQVRINHVATITNFRVGNLFISFPVPHEVSFETNAIFKVSGQNPSKTVTRDNDEILLTGSAYNLLLYQYALDIASNSAGTVATATIQRIQGKLYGLANDRGLYAIFRAKNPSEELKKISKYSSGPRFRK